MRLGSIFLVGFVGFVSLTLACASPPRRVGTEPSWRSSNGTTTTGSGDQGVIGPVRFAPTTQPVTRYNEAAPAPPRNELNDAVIAAVTEAAKKGGRPPPIADGRLFRACAELAEVVPEKGIVSYGLVEFALQRNGIIEPSPHLLVVWGDIDAPAEIVKQLEPRFAEIFADGANSRVGVGVAKRLPDGVGAIVFALQGSGVTTAPIPRSLAAGATFTLDAKVDPRFRDPEVFITRDDGTTDRLDIRSKGGAFTTPVTCKGAIGRQQIEITAIDASGSTVLANFPVWCGVEAPLSITVEPSRDDDPVTSTEQAEKRFFALVNRDRSAAGLPPFGWDEQVSMVARTYSDEMRRTKTVAHVSPTTGSAADRVRTAKIKTAVVLENVARAYGVGEAHLGLMNSPGHRTNIMSKQATHIGIGVVFGEEVSGRRELFITQVFTRVTPKVDPAQAAKTIVSKIDLVHHVTASAKLAAIAQDAATELASGKTREQVWPSVRQRVDGLGGLYGKIGSVVTAASELESIDGKQLLGDYKPDDIGVGIAQGLHPDIGEGAIWIVILMADKR